MSEKKRLFIFTNTFPHGGEVFLKEEIRYLRRYFEITVIPTAPISHLDTVVMDGIEIDTRLSQHLLKHRCKLGSIIAVVKRIPKYLLTIQPGKLLSPFRILQLLKYVVHASMVAEWVERMLVKENFNSPFPSLVYCYWMAHNFCAVAEAYRSTGVPVVFRAHGYDVYTDQSVIGFNFLQKKAIELASRVFVVSENGARYLSNRYPAECLKIKVSRLGVSAPSNGLSVSSRDGIFRLVSCSSIVPVKRVDLLMEAVFSLAKAIPEQQVEWTHLGSGPSIESLRNIARRRVCQNCRIRFLGSFSRDDVLGYYERNPVDLFINVSSSEGLPVSLMEAASFGIPLMATNVGGNSEIALASGGIVLQSHPTASEICKAICQFIDLPVNEKRNISSLSHQAFERMFSAETNFLEFCNDLNALAEKQRD